MHVEIFKSWTRIFKTGNGWFVRLVGGNGEILCVSEGYYSKYNAKRAATRMFKGLEIRYVVESQ